MSEDFEKRTDLSSNATVVMNTEEISEKLRQLREDTVVDLDSAENGFVIAPDDSDMTIAENSFVPETESETEFSPEDEEQILMPDEEYASDEVEDNSYKRNQKKKLRKLVIFAVIAAALVGILAAILVAKRAHNNAEYISNCEKAQSYYDEGQYDKALEALRRAMSIKKTDDCLILMSRCYEAKNDYVNALAILESSTSGEARIKDRIRELKKAQQAYETGNKVIIDDEEYSVDITTLDLSGRGLRSKELSRVSLLKELTSLKLNKNKIDSIDFLKKLDKLVSLDLSDNNIKDIGMLAYLNSLKTLHLDGNKVESFEPLYGLKNLTTLTISDMKISKSQLKDLKEALPNCMITSDDAEDDVVEIKLGGKTFDSSVKALDLSGRDITDISALSDCKELETLNLSGNRIRDISTLVDLPKLKSVNLSNNSISDIRPLMSITTMEYLDLSGNSISSIAALSELTALEELSLNGNRIGDFSPISNLLLLDQLDLSACGITDNALPCLYKLKDLKKLALDNNDISARAYSILQGELPNCTITHSEFSKITLGKKSFSADAVNVNASGLGLTDISAASGFSNVESMDLSNNNIKDVSPLYDLQTLRQLNLSGNNISAAQKTELKNALPNCSINFG